MSFETLAKISTACGVSMVLTASAALGRPVCDSETGKSVRNGIFNDIFFMNALATLLPFALIGIVVTAVHFGWPRRRGNGVKSVASELFP